MSEAYPIIDRRPYPQTESRIRTTATAVCVAGMLLGACTHAQLTDPRAIAAAEASDPGCSVRQLVSTGGPFPSDASTLAIRWTGFTNYELVYGGQVILLDTY